MAYATSAQIENAAGGAVELVQLADHDLDGVADTDVLAQATAEVDAMIDSYAGKRYATPISSPTVALQAVAAAEVIYWLRSKRPGLVSTDQRDQHLERVRWLEGIAKGHVVPGDPLPTQASTVRATWVARDADDEEGVTRETLKGAW